MEPMVANPEKLFEALVAVAEQLAKEDIHELRSELRALRATTNSDGMAELIEALREFVSMFELVFDGDWEMTRACVENPEYLISKEGTFITPLVDDESNNWWNRGSLLAAYRNLLSCMEKCGIQRSVPWSDE